MAALDAYVGNDTGPTHIAASLGIPTLCLFSGVVPPHLFVPTGERTRVLVAPTPCAPCGKRDLKDCFQGHACMLNMSEASALQELLSLLSHSDYKGHENSGHSICSAACR
jgi:ADP-heptose:LPS heptosyltransferase